MQVESKGVFSLEDLVFQCITKFFDFRNLLFVSLYLLFKGMWKSHGWWILFYSHFGCKTKSWLQNPSRDCHVRDSRAGWEKSRRWEDSIFSCFLFSISGVRLFFFLGVASEGDLCEDSRFVFFLSQIRPPNFDVLLRSNRSTKRGWVVDLVFLKSYLFSSIQQFFQKSYGLLPTERDLFHGDHFKVFPLLPSISCFYFSPILLSILVIFFVRFFFFH